MSVNLVTIQGDSVLNTSPPQNDSIKKGGVVLPGIHKTIPTKLIVNNDIMSKHLLLIGGTGCGKTNVFNYFIKQLKQTMSLDDIMFVFDTKGDFYSQFYKQGDIVIGNSKIYSSITSKWNIYKEILIDGWDDNDICNNAYEITYSLFKEAIERTSQQFFPNAARDILTAILIAHIRLGKDSIDFRKKFLNNKALRYFLDSISVKKIKEFLSTFSDLSSVLIYLGDGMNDQALGVLAELQNISRQIFIGAFAEDGRFSSREFVRNKGGKTLFLEYDLSIGDTLEPIYRLLFDLSLKEAMGRNKSSGNVYLICDEFKLLPNLKHIENGVNFGRGLGVKILAGLQSIEQLYEVYGESRGRNIASGFSTMIAFKSNDTITREFVSNLYGKNIVLEQYKTLNSNLTEEKREGKTVEDWDLNNLKVGEAIVGFAYEKPFKFKFDLFRG